MKNPENSAQRASGVILQNSERMAGQVVAEHYRRNPGLEDRDGPQGRIRCLEDSRYHLSYLAESVAAGSTALFVDYVGWAKVLLTGLGIPQEDLAVNLGILRDVLAEGLSAELESDALATVTATVDTGIRALPELPAALPSQFTEANPQYELACGFLDALLAGDRYGAGTMVLDAVESGTNVQDVYLNVFEPAQREIGRLWQMNRVSVAQEHFCTAATQMIMSRLYPYIFTTEKNGRRLVATCVGGDLHEIGVRMMAEFFEMEGWDTVYLGANTPAPAVIRTLLDQKADVLGVSATMAFHVSAVKALIEEVRTTSGCEDVRILVVGYPFLADRDLWRAVGADAYATDARDAVRVGARILGAPS